VIEGVREIDINNDRQMVVLTGVVRPYDISSTNMVVSTSIGQLRIGTSAAGSPRTTSSPAG
jgi:flagellar L-ring protein precursor FlgH